MFKGGWFSKSSVSLPFTGTGSSVSLSGLDEQADIICVLKAMDHVMDDNVEAAEAELDTGGSVWHKLGMGAVGFIRSAAGFEPAVMQQAASALNAAETAAYNAQRTALKSSRTTSSYAPGTEYALANAEAQLMAAVIGVLSESIIEAMKAFYKMRTAFKTLEGVHNAIREGKKKRLQKETEKASAASSLAVPSGAAPGELAKLDFKNAVDEYIESGGGLCYGTLMLFIGMIPPAMVRLLSVLGFHGDRLLGLESLWEAAEMHNSHGALAALIILTYYNNIMQFCDISETDEAKGGMPVKRCEDLLFIYRTKYKNSPLWILEEARLHASRKNLEEAVKVLKLDKKPQMKQIEALCTFENAMYTMYLKRYEQAAELLIKVKELNSWSDAMYIYIAGSCHIELYRGAEDKEKAEAYAQRAEELLLQVAGLLGKKKFMGRILPFEVFAARKVRKWQKFAASRGCRLADAVGVSPVEEMTYMWNGYNRMNEEQLAQSLKVLEWEPPKEEADNPKSCYSELDEKVLLAFLRAVLYRHQGKFDSGKDLLLNDVLSVDKTQLKGFDREDWIAPTANYEMAVIIWEQSGLDEKDKIREYLNKCAQWESYELDNRLGLRSSTALDALKNIEANI